MNKFPLLLTFFLATVCGCRTSDRVGNPSAQGGKLSLRIQVPDYLLRTELGSARIYVDGSFAGHYAEGLVLQLPPGKHEIAVQIARAYEVRQQNDGTTTVKNFKLAGEETVTVFGGESAQNVGFDMSNLKKTEIEVDDPH
jgi:hypothetical protein